jgi:hypothetical protein
MQSDAVAGVKVVGAAAESEAGLEAERVSGMGCQRYSASVRPSRRAKSLDRTSSRVWRRSNSQYLWMSEALRGVP